VDIGNILEYAEIIINGRVIETDSSAVDVYSHHNKEKNAQIRFN
jgi:hypothetical protein